LTKLDALHEAAAPSAGAPRGDSPDAVETVPLAGIDLARLTERGCLEHVTTAAASGEGGWVVTVNLDHLRRLRRDASYRALCEPATLMVADGMPLVWATRLQGTPLPERVAGSTMLTSLSGAAAERGLSVFLLGGAPGTADRAASLLKARYPTLRIGGTYCPPMGFEQDPEQWRDINEAIAQAKPHIVFVALGSPKQERLIEWCRKHHPGVWWLGVGVSFSFLCGEVRRAPRWMQVMGVEWVHRLMQEPRRLARRYLLEGVPFAAWLFVTAFRHRLRGSASAGSRRDGAYGV